VRLLYDDNDLESELIGPPKKDVNSGEKFKDGKSSQTSNLTSSKYEHTKKSLKTPLAFVRLTS